MRTALRNSAKISEKYGQPFLFELLDQIKLWRESAEIPAKGDRVTMGRFELEVTRIVFDVVSLALKKINEKV